MANISCGRCIVTKNRRTRAAHAYRLAAAVPLLVLAGVAQGEAKPSAPAEEPRVNADPAFPFSNEIAAFAKADEAGPALRDAILFLGSSSIRLWDIGASFPRRSIINRGFGGATTADVLRHYPRLLPRAKPRAVLVYVGENDLAGGASPAAVARDVLSLLKRLRTDYPAARIAYLSLKPSPIRWTLWPKMAAVNMTVAARSRVAGFDYLNVAGSLLASDGLPDASLFRKDGLHMNARGYQRWTGLVQAWLGAVFPQQLIKEEPQKAPASALSSLSD